MSEEGAMLRMDFILFVLNGACALVNVFKIAAFHHVLILLAKVIYFLDEMNGITM